MVSQGDYSDVKGSSSVRAPRRRAGTLKVRTRPTSLQKRIQKFLTSSRDSHILLRSKNCVQQKNIIFAELDLKSAKLGSARSNFITNLRKTLITMKLTTTSSSGIFKKVPEFLQRSTDRLHLDSGGSLPTFSWMIWHHTGFHSLFSLFRVPSGVRDYGVVC